MRDQYTPDRNNGHVSEQLDRETQERDDLLIEGMAVRDRLDEIGDLGPYGMPFMAVCDHDVFHVCPECAQLEDQVA